MYNCVGIYNYTYENGHLNMKMYVQLRWKRQLYVCTLQPINFDIAGLRKTHNDELIIDHVDWITNGTAGPGSPILKKWDTRHANKKGHLKWQYSHEPSSAT